MKKFYVIVATLIIVFACLAIITGGQTRPLLAAPPASESMPGQPVAIRMIDDPRPIHIPAPANFNSKQRTLKAAALVVNYLPPGPGRWGDVCTSWPAEAQSAIAYATSLAAERFALSVTITIDACWVTNFANSAILGHGGPTNYWRNFAGAPVVNTWYPDALANTLQGSDFDPATNEIFIGYNANRTDWYYGTDGNPPSNQLDLVSVAFHETLHGLGFISTFLYGNPYCGIENSGCWGIGTMSPLAYDRFVLNSSGQFLMDDFTNPSANLGAQLVSNNLFFTGNNARMANNGNSPKLYAPGAWQSGSSVSHLDYGEFSATELMVYCISQGQAKHSPGPVALGMMQDIGWTTPTLAQASSLFLPLLSR